MKRNHSSGSRWWRYARCHFGVVAYFLLVPAGFGHEAPSGDPVAEVIAAERNFAADAQRIGITPAFRAYAAPEGILMRPDPAPALSVLKHVVDAPDLRLEWQPAIAAVAISGDFGFTTGPYRLIKGGVVMNGETLTVWERGDDGRWGWVLDHGLTAVAAAVPAELPRDVIVLRQGQAGKRRRPSDVADAEAELNAAVVAQGTGAILDCLAEDGYVLRMRPGRLPKAAAVLAKSDNSRVSAAQTFGMRVSRAADLAATYGRLTLSDAGTSQNYVRIWRRDAGGWRLLIDLID